MQETEVCLQNDAIRAKQVLLTPSPDPGMYLIDVQTCSNGLGSTAITTTTGTRAKIIFIPILQRGKLKRVEKSFL